MIRTTTTYRYNLDGNITQRVVEEEEIQPEPPATTDTVAQPCSDPDCTLCVPDPLPEPVDDGCGTKSCTECYPTQPAFAGQAGNAQDTVRSTYRELSEGEKAAMARVKAAGQAFIDSINTFVFLGREKALALTNAEQAVMWATKSISGPVPDGWHRE